MSGWINEWASTSWETGQFSGLQIPIMLSRLVGDRERHVGACVLLWANSFPSSARLAQENS